MGLDQTMEECMSLWHFGDFICRHITDVALGLTLLFQVAETTSNWHKQNGQFISPYG